LCRADVDHFILMLSWLLRLPYCILIQVF